MEKPVCWCLLVYFLNTAKPHKNLEIIGVPPSGWVRLYGLSKKTDFKGTFNEAKCQELLRG